MSASAVALEVLLDSSHSISIGSTSAADLFVCMFVFIISWNRGDLLCAIGFALKFCIELIGRCYLSDFRVLHVCCNMTRAKSCGFGTDVCIRLHRDACECMQMHMETVLHDLNWFSVIPKGFA